MALDDRDATSPAEVVVLGRHSPGVSVRLRDRRYVDEHETVFITEAHAGQGLSARLDVTVFVWDHEHLEYLPGEDQDAWEVSITTWADGGEQLTALAADVRAFLA